MLVFIGIVIVFSGCAEKQTPASTPTPAPTPSAFEKADAIRGGLLYDKWWKVTGAPEPKEDNPGYLLTKGTKKGSATWRCKECHGWDYEGVKGAYGSGSHYTGVKGLLQARDKDEQTLFKTIRDGISGRPMVGFGDKLSDEDIWDLVKFIKEGIVDTNAYIKDDKSVVGGNIEKGKELYDNTCASCHGTDGKRINFADEQKPEFIGTIANDNPWEFIHKARFGQPGTSMPSTGWSIQEAIDVLSYAQTLPKFK